MQSVTDIERIHGTVLTLGRAAEHLGLHRSAFQTIAHSGLLDSVIIKGEFLRPSGGKHIRYLIPESRLNACSEIINQRVVKTKLLNSNNKLISDQAYAISCGIDVEMLRNECAEGKWDDYIADSMMNWNGQKKLYWFERKKLNERNILPLSGAAKRLKMTAAGLQEYVSSGRIKQPAHLQGTNLWDLKDLEKLLLKAREDFYQSTLDAGSKRISRFKMLSDELQALITEYIEFRSSRKFTELGSSYKTLTSSSTEELQRSLAVTFVAIICKRLDRPALQQKILSSIPDWFDPTCFDPDDIDQTDVTFLKNETGWSDQTFLARMDRLKPFLAFLVKRKRNQLDLDEFEQFKQFRKFEDRMKEIVDGTPNSRESFSRPGAFSDEKLFLNPTEWIETYQLIMSQPVARKRNGGFMILQQATMWVLGSFMGIRPEEMPMVRIHDFKLGPDFLLLTDEDGFGRMNLPAERSKQGKSPSYKKYGLLIVPRAVKHVNLYLREMYKYQQPGQDGWLFRPLNMLHSPDTPYAMKKTGWTTKLKSKLIFVPEDKRSEFELKTSRRTMHNLIRSRVLSEQDLRGKKQEWAAQIQMRHQINGTIAEMHYTEPLSVSEFKRIINATLNFPWNLDELIQWEIAMGYRSSEAVDLSVIEDQSAVEKITNTLAQNNKQAKAKIEQLQSLIASSREKLVQLRLRPKDMSVRQWLDEKTSIRHKIKLAEVELQHVQQQLAQ